MGNGVSIVDQNRYPSVGQEGGGSVLGCGIALVQDSLNPDAPFSGIYQGLGNGFGGEAVGLDQDFLTSSADLADDGFGGTAVG